MLQSMHWFAVRTEWGLVGESIEPLTMHKFGVWGCMSVCMASCTFGGHPWVVVGQAPWQLGGCGALGPPWEPSRLGFLGRCKGVPSATGAATLSLHVVLRSVGRLAVSSCVSGWSLWLHVWPGSRLAQCCLQPSYMHPASHSS